MSGPAEAELPARSGVEGNVTPHARTAPLLAGLCLAAAVGGCANTPPCSGAACGADDATTAAVTALFAQHPALRPPNSISVQTHGGTVYLYGIVDTAMEWRVASEVAAEAPGAKQVVNLIGIDNGR